MIPAGFIQDLLARADIVTVIGGAVELKKAGQNWVGLCPFHGEKTPSFTVSQAKQFFHCFGCGAHGSSIGFLMDHRGLSYVEAIRELAHQVGMTVPDDGRPEVADALSRNRSLTALLEKAAEHFRTGLRSSASAIAYLKGRGVSGRTAARFGIGYVPDEWQSLRAAFDDYEQPSLVDAGLVIADEGKRYDRFRGRIMFPIRTRRGAVIGFGGRVLDDGEPKYLNSPETAVFKKGQELYGLFEAQEAIRTKGRAIVCEGYMDVVALAQADFEEAVAALGTAITGAHVATLFRLTDHVYFAFDGDAAGRKAARRALEAALPVIGDQKRASFVLLPEPEDPDSLIRAQGPAAFEAELERALPLSRWFVEVLSVGKALDTPEGRAAFVADAKPLLQSMPGGALPLQLVDEVARVARMAAPDVGALVGVKTWRRLPPRAQAPGRRRELLEVINLKEKMLRELVAFPALAREFNAQIANEFLDGAEPIARQIAEVWRAATAAADGTEITGGALLELLTDSEFADVYNRLAAEALKVNQDITIARAELQGGFHKLELLRIEAQLTELVAQGDAPDLAAEYRRLSDRRAELKAVQGPQSP